MGNLCSKNSVKKKREGHPAGGGDVGGPGAPTDSSAAASVSSHGSDRISGTHLPEADESRAESGTPHTVREQRQGTEPFEAADTDHFGGAPDESSSVVQDAETSVATRADLFPEGQDAALNMRIGTEKYRDLATLTSSDEGHDGHDFSDDRMTSVELHSLPDSSASTPERARTPERQRSVAEGAYKYDPSHFFDEDTSLIERRSDAFQTPHDTMTEATAASESSRMRLAPFVAAVPTASAPRPQRVTSPLVGAPPLPPLPTPLPVPLPTPALTPPKPSTTASPLPGHSFRRQSSANSLSSFTVTTVRNNNRLQVPPIPVHSPLGDPTAGAASPSEMSEPYADPAMFYSCRSDATTATSVRGWGGLRRPAAPALSSPAPDPTLRSSRSVDSASARSPPPAARATATPAAIAAAAQKAVGTKPGSGGRPSTIRPIPNAQRALAPNARVVRAIPTSLPLPRPPPGAVSTTAAPPATGAGAAPRVAAAVPAPVAASSALSYSIAPPASSAFRSFPPTPSALGGHTHPTSASPAEADFRSAISPTNATTIATTTAAAAAPSVRGPSLSSDPRRNGSGSPRLESRNGDARSSPDVADEEPIRFSHRPTSEPHAAGLAGALDTPVAVSPLQTPPTAAPAEEEAGVGEERNGTHAALPSAAPAVPPSPPSPPSLKAAASSAGVLPAELAVPPIAAAAAAAVAVGRSGRPDGEHPSSAGGAVNRRRQLTSSSRRSSGSAVGGVPRSGPHVAATASTSSPYASLYHPRPLLPLRGGVGPAAATSPLLTLNALDGRGKRPGRLAAEGGRRLSTGRPASAAAATAGPGGKRGAVAAVESSGRTLLRRPPPALAPARPVAETPLAATPKAKAEERTSASSPAPAEPQALPLAVPVSAEARFFEMIDTIDRRASMEGALHEGLASSSSSIAANGGADEV